MGYQYAIVHNNALQEVLNCNTNVQIGDPSQVYYNTLCNTKTTQEDDVEQFRRINNTSCRRLLRVQSEIDSGECNRNEVCDHFVDGLCMPSAAINAAMSRDFISATMAPLLVCSGGTRFRFSHGFGYLFITQLIETLQGK